MDHPTTTESDNGLTVHLAERLKNKRAAKKGSITKRINEITQLINDNGSRTKVKFLLKALLKVKEEAQELDSKLASSTSDHDETWMEAENERCDTISADVEEYLEQRKDDAPSTLSLTESWVQQHTPAADHSVIEELNTNTNSISTAPFLYDLQNTYHKHPMRPSHYTGFNTLPVFTQPPVRYPLSTSASAFNPSGGFHPTPSTSISFSNHTAGVSSTRKPHNLGKPPKEANTVDSWIDDLDPTRPVKSAAPGDADPELMMGSWFVQQSLPRMEIPEFNGAPTSYIEFITKIRDLVHNQPYLNDIQRSSLLLQHLKGEAKVAVKAYSRDWSGYVLALKRIKFLFGQRSAIARSVLTTVTKGKVIQDDDPEGLSQFYYAVSDCLTTLGQLNYASDLFSSDTLIQTVKRLPRRLINKWADYGYSLRQRNEEPNLYHFESWLQARVLSQREACVVESQPKVKKHINMTRRGGGRGSHHGGNREENRSEEIVFWKTKWFVDLDPQKKYEKVFSDKLCFNCLKGGHVSESCPSSGICRQKGCKKRHHTVLHEYFSASKPNSKGDDENAEGDVEVKDGSGSEHPNNPTSLMIRGTGDVYLQVVQVLLRANNRFVKTFALLDGGSMFTLIRDSIKQKLGLQGEEGQISYETVKETDEDEEPEKVPATKVSLSVSSLDGETSFLIKSAFAVSKENFNMPAQPNPIREMNGEIPSYIKDLNLRGVKPSQISILIGADCADATLAKEVRRGEPGQPLAINTMLGWTLFGASTKTSQTVDGQTKIHANLVHQSSHFVRNAIPRFVQFSSKVESEEVTSLQRPLHSLNISSPQSSDDKLDSALETFWKQEQALIAPPKDTAMSQEDVKALHQLEAGTRIADGHYEVPMLWSHADIQLPNNYALARQRFDPLIRRLRSNPDLYSKYQDVINRLIEKGYAERMSEEEVAVVGPRTWYLPHHPVFNVNKPGKVRVVNDAAAKFQGASLNSSLVTGPDLLNPLIGVLIKFRRDPIAIAGDVEAMFHQVRVSKEDSDSLRFLWTDNIFSDDAPHVMKMLVHIFGAKDSMTCCCFALQLTARDNAHLMSAMTFETILKNFYADDLLRSIHSEEAAIKLIEELMVMLKRGGFRLTKFVSNSKKVLDSIPVEDVSPSATLNFDGEALERVLGILWDVLTDTFTFIYRNIQAASTKRGILKVTCSIFDPLGLIVPFILIAKLLLQELWRLSYDWDEILPPDLLLRWEKWKAAAPNITEVRIPRCFFPGGSSVVQIQLHIFGDASELAYGSVAYLRFTFKDGHHEVSYLISKSKLAPLKTVTLPRLELSAAVTAVRLYRNVIHEIDLPVEKTYFWTDSTLTYQYISNTKHRFKVYPANRVTEILETSILAQWRLLPGDLNPADILTRGVQDPSQLMMPNKNKTSWFNSAEFLSQDEDQWPQLNGGLLSDDDLEIKRKSVLLKFGLLYISHDHVSEQIDFSRFSTWMKLKRVTGWILRFISNTKGLQVTGDFSALELQNAEHFIIKDVQHTVFQEEMECLRSRKVIPRGHCLGSLSPFIDDRGALRVGGRLRKASLPSDAKHQLILPRAHPVTTLIINHEHVSNGHIPPEHVLSNLRQRYWIINGRVAIKTVLKRCFFCQVKHARQMFPYMADLPECRSAFLQPPFANCGVDGCGPFYIKQGRKRLKRWVILFTCLTVRCVHLEVVDSQDTDDFINAFRRFTNRRGSPVNVYSDCGSNFKGAVNELEDLFENLDKDAVKSFAAGKGIAWNFNPPSAPHMGGVWERLIRSVKEVMAGLLSEKILTDAQLATLTTEIESILNNRPLTHISDNVNDLEALTPNHILLGLHRNWESVCGVDEGDATSRKHWRQVQALSIQFWERWRKEFLPKLTKRTKWQNQVPNYEVGELVVLSDELSKKKGKWSLARIIRTMPGDDGIVRTVELKTPTGTLVRPTAKLYRLEENINVR